MNKYDFYSNDEKNKINNNCVNTIVLNKDNTINICFDNEFIKNNTSDNIEILRKSIINYINILRFNCKNFNPTIFINNFKRTVFKLGNINSDNKGFVRISNPNKLYIETIDIINHELLHLSSIKKDFYGILFYVYDESYTQALAERYFNENTGLVYPYSVKLIQKIENIIDKDIMEEKYFKGKLFSTIKYLYKYESKENIDNLLLYLIKVHSLEKHLNSENELEIYVNKANLIINNCLNNKLTGKQKKD